MQDANDDFMTPQSQVVSSSKSMLRFADVVPFDVDGNDVSPQINPSSGTTPGSNASDKRSFVDLDKEDEELDEKAKGKKPMFSTDLDNE